MPVYKSPQIMNLDSLEIHYSQARFYLDLGEMKRNSIQNAINNILL